MATLRRIKLGSQGLEVSVQGLGCFGMTGRYGPPKPEPNMIGLIRDAVERGITLFDTADFYGHFANEVLLGKALKGGWRDRVELATKFGIIYGIGRVEPEVRGDPAYVRAACEASLKRLDTHCIDLYYQHRIDTRVPVEIVMGKLKKLVEEGKIKYIGLSEASASTIRREGHMLLLGFVLHWELGIGIVAYSPLGPGFFGSGAKMAENLANDDLRKRLPRFQPENIEHNKTVFEWINEMAARKGCTPAQLALAWVHHQGNDVCPIPGTTEIENLKQNIGALCVKLTPEEMAELERFADAVKGDRYWAQAPTWKNSDTLRCPQGNLISRNTCYVCVEK